MKRVSVGLLIIAVIVSIVFAFVVFVQQEKLEQEALDAQATAVTGSNLYSTAEAEREIVVETAVALGTALHEQQIEATAVAEADSHATPEAETLLLDQQDLAYQLALESTHNLNERPNLIQQGALLALEAVQRYPDEWTVQSLTNALQLLPDHDTKILENSDDAPWYTFSDDGRYLASNEESLYIYETETGRLLSQINDKYYHDYAFSPADNLIAALNYQDRSVKIWETFTSKEILEINENIGSFKFSPVGNYIAVLIYGEYKLTLQIWSVEEKQIVLQVPVDTYFAFSPDEKFIYVVDNYRLEKVELTTGLSETLDENVVGSSYHFSPQSNHLLVLNYDIGHQIKRLDSQQTVLLQSTQLDWSQRVLFSPNEKFLAAYSTEGGTGGLVYGHDRVYVWDVATGLLLMELEAAPQAMAFSPDSRLFAVSLGNFVRVWETEQFQEIARISIPAFRLMFTPDNKQLLTAGREGVDRWNLEVTPTRLRIAQEDGDGRKIDAVAYSPTGERVVTGGQSGFVHIWNTETAEELHRFDHGYDISTVSFSPDGDYLLIGSGLLPRIQPVLRLWNVVDQTDVMTATFDANVEHSAFSSDGKMFAFVTGLYTDTVYIHETASGAQINTINDTVFLGIAFSANGRYLATRGYDPVGGVSSTIWDVQTGAPVLPTEEAIELFAFSPDDRYVAGVGIMTGGQRMINVWQFPSGEGVAQIPIEWEIDDLIYSPDGKYLAFSNAYGGHLMVYDTANWMALVDISGPGYIFDLTFTLDSRYLAFTNNNYSASMDVIIWDMTANRAIERLVHAKPVYQVEFNPNGKQLLTQSGDTDVFLWRWHPDDLIAEACHRLSHNLTMNEWRLYLGSEPYHATCPELPVP